MFCWWSNCLLYVKLYLIISIGYFLPLSIAFSIPESWDETYLFIVIFLLSIFSCKKKSSYFSTGTYDGYKCFGKIQIIIIVRTYFCSNEKRLMFHQFSPYIIGKATPCVVDVTVGIILRRFVYHKISYSITVYWMESQSSEHLIFSLL